MSTKRLCVAQLLSVSSFLLINVFSKSLENCSIIAAEDVSSANTAARYGKASQNGMKVLRPKQKVCHKTKAAAAAFATKRQCQAKITIKNDSSQSASSHCQGPTLKVLLVFDFSHLFTPVLENHMIHCLHLPSQLVKLQLLWLVQATTQWGDFEPFWLAAKPDKEMVPKAAPTIRPQKLTYLSFRVFSPETLFRTFERRLESEQVEHLLVLHDSLCFC